MTQRAPSRKDLPWGKSNPDQRWDDIVVGSGMGGMTVANMLTRMGRRVLVLEQHDVAGGFTHTFKRKRWRWDVGVHAIGQVTSDTQPGRMLAYLTDGALCWSSLGRHYELFHYPDGFQFGFADRQDQFRRELEQAFPRERAAIKGYFRTVALAQAIMGAMFTSRALPSVVGMAGTIATDLATRSFLRRTTKQVLDDLTGHEQLKTVLTGQWGYYGLPPSRAPFGLHAIVANHYLNGAYFPVGGAGRIAECLLRPVVQAGGCVRVCAPVARILVERDRAVGVRLENGEEMRADRVVSDAGVPGTLTLLPGEHRPSSWREAMSGLRASPAHVCLYMGFEGDIRAAGATAANHWFMESWNHDWDRWDVRAREALAPVLYTSFGSLKDAEHEPGPRITHAGEVITFVDWEPFAAWEDRRWQKRGSEYEQFKNDLAGRLAEQLFRWMPDLRRMLKFSELSTPLSTHHFARTLRGGIYGVESSGERYRNRHLRPRTPVRGLFLTGADVAGPGVMGAFGGALMTAGAMEPIKAPILMAKAAR